MPLYDVTFWPQRTVRVTADDEADAVCLALHQREYPGGFEHDTHGARGMFWVKEVEEPVAPPPEPLTYRDLFAWATDIRDREGAVSTLLSDHLKVIINDAEEEGRNAEGALSLLLTEAEEIRDLGAAMHKELIEMAAKAAGTVDLLALDIAGLLDQAPPCVTDYLDDLRETGNKGPLHLDTDGNGIWTDGFTLWNTGEPFTESEGAEVESRCPHRDDEGYHTDWPGSTSIGLNQARYRKLGPFKFACRWCGCEIETT